ncbi:MULTISPECIES: hypothetical protein [unclassified Rhizobium]
MATIGDHREEDVIAELRRSVTRLDFHQAPGPAGSHIRRMPLKAASV